MKNSIIKKICILGATGLLGKTLYNQYKKKGYIVVGCARKNTDVCFDISNDIKLTEFLNDYKFDIVINTVAIVNHDYCEKNPETAYMINARPSAILAQLSKVLNFKYVYISTDGYFTNNKNKKHDEQHAINLLNEYARTKYIGEQFTLTSKNSLVIRTNIVGFKQGDNQTFVEWAISTIKNKENLVLFNDYYTSSISVKLFSECLIDLINKQAVGLYNLASSEVSSKKEFIEQMAKIFELELTNTKIGTVDSLTSKRANSLGLDVTKAETILQYKLPSLKEILIQLKEEYDDIYK